MMWKPIGVFLLVTLVVCGILGFRLGSLQGNVSTTEKAYIASVDSGRELIREPVYLLHKLPIYLLFKLDVKRIAIYRMVSGMYAAVAVVSCFFILREWFSDRIALLTTWLFLTSAWLLHIGRLATPEALYFLILPLLWTAIWLYNTTLRKSALLVLGAVCALSFYLPGFGVLLIAIAIWQHKRIWAELKEVPLWFRLSCAGLILVILIPLVYASVREPATLLSVAGLPHTVPSLSALGDNALRIPAYLLARGPANPEIWLGRLPLLDAFSATMLLFGIYSLRFHMRLLRNQILFASSIYFALLIVSGGLVTITILLPFVYILVASGLAFFLQQWLTVFPNNPIARGLGITLVTISVLFVSFFHLSHYFIAWPQTPATRAAFRNSLVK